MIEQQGLARSLVVRPGVGASAHVLQHRSLEIVRLHINQSALIIVRRGVKTLRYGNGLQVQAQPGQAIALAGGQTVDFHNTVAEGTHYEAHWVVFDNALVADFITRHTDAITPHTASPRKAWLVPAVDSGLHGAFDGAHQALHTDSRLPEAVARHRVREVLLWLALDGGLFDTGPALISTSARVRALWAGRLDHPWMAAEIASALAISEPTLRRRLAAEGTGLGELLIEARMSFALTLLQATTRPIADIAEGVGYASASRFAVRFRQRFGFAPSAIRGHERV